MRSPELTRLHEVESRLLKLWEKVQEFEMPFAVKYDVSHEITDISALVRTHIETTLEEDLENAKKA